MGADLFLTPFFEMPPIALTIAEMFLFRLGIGDSVLPSPFPDFFSVRSITITITHSFKCRHQVNTSDTTYEDPFQCWTLRTQFETS